MAGCFATPLDELLGPRDVAVWRMLTMLDEGTSQEDRWELHHRLVRLSAYLFYRPIPWTGEVLYGYRLGNTLLRAPVSDFLQTLLHAPGGDPWDWVGPLRRCARHRHILHAVDQVYALEPLREGFLALTRDAVLFYSFASDAVHVLKRPHNRWLLPASRLTAGPKGDVGHVFVPLVRDRGRRPAVDHLAWRDGRWHDRRLHFPSSTVVHEALEAVALNQGVALLLQAFYPRDDAPTMLFLEHDGTHMFLNLGPRRVFWIHSDEDGRGLWLLWQYVADDLSHAPYWTHLTVQDERPISSHAVMDYPPHPLFLGPPPFHARDGTVADTRPRPQPGRWDRAGEGNDLPVWVFRGLVERGDSPRGQFPGYISSERP